MKKMSHILIFTSIAGILMTLIGLKINNKNNCLFYQNVEALSHIESGYNVDCVTVPIDIDCEVILELVDNDYRVVKINNAIKVYL